MVEQFLQGNAAAFEELVIRYEQKVFQLAYRLSGDLDDASDLAQEAFLKVYKYLGQWQGKASFSTWLYRIVTNAFLDDVRKRKRRPPVAVSLDASIPTEDGEVLREFPSTDAGPEQEYLRLELQQMVQTALSELEPEYRVMLTLRDIQGHSYEEIAQITQLKLGTVKSRISRARAALRKKLRAAEQYAELLRQI
ncbi:MAG: sigma-70 family RNA polymerase sigma factor [Firmicutes bacterium]|nr:sigma-70 family RNA polymerase sigma factor [Bacillota bacterium]